ncbi:uncharacterized protein [Heptranchias perlo]|uniref:uncharacterized protein n=1 Tax=Heptranchias perlo TaxID=212740 RepID=UPI003559DFE3
MDKVLVDGIPIFHRWTSVNDIIHKRWSLFDTKQSLLQHEWKNSSQTQHFEETKPGSQTVNRIPHPGSIVSQRKAFFESHLKLPVPVTKDPTKPVRIPATLKLSNPDPAATSIVDHVRRPCHFSKEDDNTNIVEAKSGRECNRFSPIQKHSAIEKGRQLIGLYQAICEKVGQSPYDSKRAISMEEVTVPHKEKTSQTLQDRLRYLLSEESDNLEGEKEKVAQYSSLKMNPNCTQMSSFVDEDPGKYLQMSHQVASNEESGYIQKPPHQNVTLTKLRSKQQSSIQENRYNNDSITKSPPPTRPSNKYQKVGLIESKSAFIHERIDCIPRAAVTAIFCQGSLPLDKVHGKSALDTTPNNAPQPKHGYIISRTNQENSTNQRCLSFHANQDCATAKPTSSSIENKPIAVCWQADSEICPQSNTKDYSRAGLPLQPTSYHGSKSSSVFQDRNKSLHQSANQTAQSLEVIHDRETEVRTCSEKMALNETLVQENSKIKSLPLPFFPVKALLINQPSSQQNRQAPTQSWSTDGIDCSEKEPSQSDPSFVFELNTILKSKSLNHIESTNSVTDKLVRRLGGNSIEDSNVKDQLRSISLSNLHENALVLPSNNTKKPNYQTASSCSGEEESDSPHLSSLIQPSCGDSVSMGTTTLSQMEDIRQHLQSLEADYQELVTLLSRDSRTLPAHRKLMRTQKGQSAVKNGKLLAQLTLQRQKDICTVQRRFAHLEAHVLLLARNIAHLTDEIGSQNSLLQKIHSLQQEIQKTQHTYNKVAGDPDRLSIKQNSSSISELFQCYGERPPMMTIFLKKLGYEQYVPHFENAAIGLMELPYLNEERLTQLGIPLGPRLRILHEVTSTTYV